ncbi:hypothetical protein V6N13_109767 [Hibiscus sabdariffa]
MKESHRAQGDEEELVEKDEDDPPQDVQWVSDNEEESRRIEEQFLATAKDLKDLPQQTKRRRGSLKNQQEGED